jgi:hypothetical protein
VSRSASATKTPVPPSGPTREAVPTVESTAVAALDRYFRSANNAAQGGSLRQFRALFSDTCVACVSAYQDFKSARQSGLTADRDRYSSWEIRFLNETGRTALLTSSNDFAAVDLVDSSGTTAERIDPWEGAQFAWTLQRRGDGWLIIRGDLL